MKMMSVLCVLCTLWSKTFDFFTDLISALKLSFLNKIRMKNNILSSIRWRFLHHFLFLGRITIWNPWSIESDANLEDSACTVRVLFFFPICTLAICFRQACYLQSGET